MAEYIEREALLREIERREALMVGDKLVSIDAMKSFIKNRPAEDVAPVRNGRWIAPFLSDSGNMCAECSNCHRIRIFDDYCSACGATMDLNDLED